MLYVLGMLYLVRILPLELQTKVNGNLHSNLVKVLLELFSKKPLVAAPHVTFYVIIYSEDISLSNWSVGIT